MKLRKYETMFILRSTMKEDEVNGFLKMLEGLIGENGGEKLEDAQVEKKQLQYPIKKENSGYYVIFTYNAPSSFNGVLSEKLRYSKDVLRYMPVVLD